MAKQIRLFKTNLFTVVDDEDFIFLSKFTWYLMSAHNCFYARTVINATAVLMHQLILPSPSKHITPDHVDGNGLNNQRFNLRLATRTQQEANKPKCDNKCSSKFKGVNKTKSGTWRAYIKTKGVQISLSFFKSEIEAAKKYNEAAIKHFGDFAKLNKIEEYV